MSKKKYEVVFLKIKTKNIIGFVLAIVLMLPCARIVVKSASATTEVTEPDLFYGYPTYLKNKTANKAISGVKTICYDYIGGIEKSDEILAAIQTSSTDGLKILLMDFGAWLGLTGSYYDESVDKAVQELLKSLYSDKQSVTALAVAERAGKELKWIKNVTDLSAPVVSKLTAMLSTNLNNVEIDDLCKMLKDNCSKVFDVTTEMADVAKYICVALLLEDIQMDMINVLIDTQEDNSDLKQGLLRLKADMKKDVLKYTYETYIEKKALSEIAKASTKLFTGDFIGAGTPAKLLGDLVVKFGIWLTLDVLWPHENASEIMTAIHLTNFSTSIDTAIQGYLLSFYDPFYVSHIDKYRMLYSAYIDSTKAAGIYIKKLCKDNKKPELEQRLVTAMNNLNNTVSGYDDYCRLCIAEINAIPYEQRIKRIPVLDKFYNINNRNIQMGDLVTVSECDERIYAFEGSSIWGLKLNNTNIFLTNTESISTPHLSANGGRISAVSGTAGINSTEEMSLSGVDATGVSFKAEKACTLSGTTNLKSLCTEGTLTLRSAIVNGENTLIKGNLTLNGSSQLNGVTTISGNLSQTITGSTLSVNGLSFENTSAGGVDVQSVINVSGVLSNPSTIITNGKNIYLCSGGTIRDLCFNSDVTLNGGEVIGNTNFKHGLRSQGNSYISGNPVIDGVLDARDTLTIGEGCTTIVRDDAALNSLSLPGKGCLSLQGDLTCSSVSGDSMSYRFNGCLPQTINGSINMQNLRFENSHSGGVTVNNAINVYGELSDNGSRINGGKNIVLEPGGSIPEGKFSGDLSVKGLTCIVPTTIKGMLYTLPDCIIKGTKLSLEKSLVHSSGTLKIDENSSMRVGGYCSMNSGALNNLGSMEIIGDCTMTNMTVNATGALRFSGDLMNYGGSNSYDSMTFSAPLPQIIGGDALNVKNLSFNNSSHKGITVNAQINVGGKYNANDTKVT
ncbi:MAG: hypothetical protein RSA97_04125, partial [Oscillospiraceae bacterium]